MCSPTASTVSITCLRARARVGDLLRSSHRPPNALPAVRRPGRGQCDITVAEHSHDAAAAVAHRQESEAPRAHLAIPTRGAASGHNGGKVQPILSTLPCSGSRWPVRSRHVGPWAHEPVKHTLTRRQSKHHDRAVPPNTTWYCVRRDGTPRRSGWMANVALNQLPRRVRARGGDTVEVCIADEFREVPLARFSHVFRKREAANSAWRSRIEARMNFHRAHSLESHDRARVPRRRSRRCGSSAITVSSGAPRRSPARPPNRPHGPRSSRRTGRFRASYARRFCAHRKPMVWNTRRTTPSRFGRLPRSGSGSERRLRRPQSRRRRRRCRGRRRRRALRPCRSRTAGAGCPSRSERHAAGPSSPRHRVYDHRLVDLHLVGCGDHRAVRLQRARGLVRCRCPRWTRPAASRPTRRAGGPPRPEPAREATRAAMDRRSAACDRPGSAPRRR